jgi:hypothetical protein
LRGHDLPQLAVDGERKVRGLQIAHGAPVVIDHVDVDRD